jgi:hypothetical protein
VGEYCKIFGNASATKFRPSEDLANTFGLKLLHLRYLPVFGQLFRKKARFPVH